MCSANRAQLFEGSWEIYYSVKMWWKTQQRRNRRKQPCARAGTHKHRHSRRLINGLTVSSACAAQTSAVCTIPSGSSDRSTLQKGGAQPGSQWHLLSWLQTCQRSQKVSQCVCFPEVAKSVNEPLTPWLLHLAEQSFVPYAFMLLMSWQRWL